MKIIPEDLSVAAESVPQRPLKAGSPRPSYGPCRRILRVENASTIGRLPLCRALSTKRETHPTAFDPLEIGGYLSVTGMSPFNNPILPASGTATTPRVRSSVKSGERVGIGNLVKSYITADRIRFEGAVVFTNVA